MPKLTLTDAFIQGAACPTGKAQEDYRDEGSRGLALRVSKTGRKVWAFFYSIDGRERRLTLGEYGKKKDQLTLAKARNEAEAIRVRIRQGEDPARTRDERKASRRAEAADSVRSVLERRIRKLERDGRRPSYIKDMRGRFATHILPRIGDKAIAHVTERDVRSILDPIEAKGQASTHNRVLVMLSPLFKFADAPDPTDKIDPLPEKESEARFTIEEIANLWRAFEDREAKIHPLTRIALRLAVLTLKRSGECAGATVGEIDHANKVWNIPANRMKGNRAEAAVLTNMAMLEIDAALNSPFRPADEEQPHFLFPSPRDYSKPILQPSMSKAFARAKVVAGLGRHAGTLHNLRHSGATALAASGVSPYVVQALLSHAPSAAGVAAVSGRYNAYDLINERRAALETYANWLSKALEDTSNPRSNVVKISAPDAHAKKNN